MLKKSVQSHQIRVLLLGLGSVATDTHGGGHLRQYLDDPEIIVVAGVDSLQSARERAMRKGIPAVYENFYEALEKEEFDYVSVLTPTHMHLECCRMVANAQKNILCEKPIAHQLEDAVEIERVVKANNVSFSVSMNLRFLPVVKQIQDDIEKGKLGKLFFIDFDECTSFNWATYGYRNPESKILAKEPFWGNPENFGLQRLVISDKAVHFIDLIIRWSGEKILSVYAQGGCHGSHMDAGENFANITLHLSGGVQSRLLHIWGSHFDDRAGGELSTRIRILGEDGTAIYESSEKGIAGEYTIFKEQKQTYSLKFPPSRRTDFAESLKYLAKLSSKEKTDYENLNHSLKLMNVIEACYKSIETNSVVEIKG